LLFVPHTGAIRWGTRGTRPPTFSDSSDIICHVPQGIRRELLPVLTGIPPANLRREHCTFKLALQAQRNTNHLLHTLVHSIQFLGTHRLRSRRPFHCHAAALLNAGFNLLESWRAACESATPLAQFLVTPSVCFQSGSELPRILWVALNRLRTGVYRFGTCLYAMVCLRGGERGTCLGPPLEVLRS